VVRSLRQLVTRRWRLVATGAAVLAVGLAAPSLARVPARVLAGCLGWVALATGLELLSVAGFVLVFTLAFRAAGVAGAGPGAGLRSLAAATLLPAGGLVGPVAGSLGPDTDTATIRRLTRTSIGLVALTSAPLFIAVMVIGVMLRLGWLDGPHETLLTLVPAAIALITVVVAWQWSRRCPTSRESTVALLRSGLAHARELALEGDWRLVGGPAYYGFDSAVLWAAFHAFGQTPPLGAVVMGYVLGVLASSLPTPAGIGALEGGLVGGLVLYGAAAGPAATAVLLYRAISLSVPLCIGGVAWIEKLLPRKRPPNGLLRRGRAAAATRARTYRPHPRSQRAGTRR
jgi:uncharacterized membrane protein YbhN (UPF0104 family)